MNTKQVIPAKLVPAKTGSGNPEMQKNFREGKFFAGVCRGIQKVGEKLRANFPGEKINLDELPDEISKNG